MHELPDDDRLPWVFRDEVLILETRRHWMRWPVARDASLVARTAPEWSDSGLVSEAVRGETPSRAEDWIAWTRERNKQGSALCLTVAEKASPSDTVGIVSAAVAPDGDLTLGVLVAPELRQRGRGSEALQGVICALGLVSRPRNLVATVERGNTAGVRLLVRNGFAKVKDAPAGDEQIARAAHGVRLSRGLGRGGSQGNAPRRICAA